MEKKRTVYQMALSKLTPAPSLLWALDLPSPVALTPAMQNSAC